MADQTKPNSNQAPDPSRSYERAQPEAEPGMGSLDAPISTPTSQNDRIGQAVTNAQPPRQINAMPGQAAEQKPAPDKPLENAPNLPPPAEPDHSMYQEEPTDPDLAPTDIHDPRQQRHPRREGKGGTP